eukprot:5076468-Amphidinium_carterae.1
MVVRLSFALDVFTVELGHPDFQVQNNKANSQSFLECPAHATQPYGKLCCLQSSISSQHLASAGNSGSTFNEILRTGALA